MSRCHEERLAELRRAFDQSFVEPARGRSESPHPLLAVRVGGTACALRSIELTEVTAAGRIVPVPSRHPEMVGIVGMRGTLVPVFDLAALLGQPASGRAPRWLARAAGASPVAFGLDGLEGAINTEPGCLYDNDAPAGTGYVRQFIRTRSSVLPVIEIAAIVRAILERVGHFEQVRNTSL